MKHGKLGSKFYCDEMNQERKDRRTDKVEGGEDAAGFGCFGQSATRAVRGHLWVSAWDTSGESGVSGELLASPRSSWTGTETERPFFWQIQSSLAQLHHQRRQQKQRHDQNINNSKHSQQAASRHPC